MKNEKIEIADNGKTYDLVLLKEGKIEKITDETLENLFMDSENFVEVIDFVKARVSGLVADPLTKDGSIAIKSLAKKIGSISKGISDRKTAINRILKERPRKIDAQMKRVIDTLDAEKEKVLAPLKEIESRKDEIVQIGNLPASAVGCDSAGCDMVLDQINAFVRTPEYWKESASEASDAIREAVRQVTDMKNAALKKESDARELEELRKQKEEAARILAEEQERKIREAEEERKKLEAENKKLKQSVDEAKAEASLNADIETQRVDADLEYRRKCNREMLDDLKKEGIEDAIAKLALNLIFSGKIRHIRIVY